LTKLPRQRAVEATIANFGIEISQDIAHKKTSNLTQRFPHTNAQRPEVCTGEVYVGELQATHTAKILVSARLLRFCSGRAPWTKPAWETI
jgi:hypothetical protein